MSTSKQTAANRRNAQRSTGPRSAKGKAASRSNSLKTGLYARSQIIAGEDPAELRALSDRYFLRGEPATPEESFLVATLIDSDWLLRRYSLADAQIWNYHADSMYVRESPHPKGMNFICAREHFPILQRRSDSAQRNWHRALRDLERLQTKRLAPTPPAEKPDSDPPPKSKPNSTQPQSAQQKLRFVPSFSPAPDSPPPDPPTGPADPERPKPQALEPVTICPDEPLETGNSAPPASTGPERPEAQPPDPVTICPDGPSETANPAPRPLSVAPGVKRNGAQLTRPGPPRHPDALLPPAARIEPLDGPPGVYLRNPRGQPL